MIEWSRKLKASYRLVELPLLLIGRQFTQRQLTDIYEVDRKTIVSDLKIIAEYWPLAHEKRGRFMWYSMPADAQPTLPRIGNKRRK